MKKNEKRMQEALQLILAATEICKEDSIINDLRRIAQKGLGVEIEPNVREAYIEGQTKTNEP